MRVKQIKMLLDLDPSTRSYGRETIVYINYDNSDKRGALYRAHHKDVLEKRFYVDLPQIVADALGYTTSRGDTQEEAFAEFKADLERFRNLETERNLVILYEIKVEPHPEKKEPLFGAGYSVDVWSGTYEETIAIAGNGERRYSYEKKESSLSYPGGDHYAVSSRSRGRSGQRFDHQIPWTEQNEAFFIWIGERITELISRLAELEDPGKLIENINAGRLLPLGQQEAE